MARTNQFIMPQMRKPPAIAFSPGKNQFFVQGQTFAGDDFASALQSEALLSQPGVDLPQGDDWIEIDPESYAGLLKNIREPSLGTLASKSFGRGVDVSQALVGRGLQLAGAEELGGGIVAAQEEQLRKTSPFERQFTDIESGRDAVEWFVANFAQQGPNMIESVVTAGLGFLAGTALVSAVHSLDLWARLHSRNQSKPLQKRKPQAKLCRLLRTNFFVKPLALLVLSLRRTPRTLPLVLLISTVNSESLALTQTTSTLD
jgi:hypothetical protein